MVIASTLSHIPEASVELVELLDLGIPSHLMTSDFKDSVDPCNFMIDGLNLMGIEPYIFDAFSRSASRSADAKVSPGIGPRDLGTPDLAPDPCKVFGHDFTGKK